MKTILAPPPRQEPCSPSPCGPNAQCRVVNDQAVCSCLPNYNGSPPNCRPECVVSSECPSSRACINNKCSDPCPNTCGVGAQCTTKNHNPICACPAGQTGDPFVRCSPIRKSFARWIFFFSFGMEGKRIEKTITPRILFQPFKRNPCRQKDLHRATHHLAARMPNVKWLETSLHVLVCRISSDLLLIVVRNVSLVPNARAALLASIRNAEIRARDLAELMLAVTF